MGWLVIAAGVGLAVVRFVGGLPPERDLVGALGAAALGTAVAAPGVLALLARRGRPGLLLPAAVVLVPLSFLSFALVTLPLLIPAFLLVRLAARVLPGRDLARAAAAAVLVLTLQVGAVGLLFAHQDPREWAVAADGSVTEVARSTEQGSASYGPDVVAGYGTGDVITPIEALASLATTATAVTLGWVLTSPRRPTRW